jgi:hypothetical protein
MVMIATAAGLALGLLLAFLIAAPVVRWLSTGCMRPQLVRGAAVFGVILAAGPAFFLAIVVGGNLGGAWGEVALGSAGVVVGLGLGAAAVFGVTLAVGACLLAFVVRAGLQVAGRRNAL